MEELRPVLVEIVLVTKATQDWTAVSVMMATTEMVVSVQVCTLKINNFRSLSKVLSSAIKRLF